MSFLKGAFDRRTLLIGGMGLLSAPLGSSSRARAGTGAGGGAFSRLPRTAVRTVSTFSSISIELTGAAPSTSATGGRSGSCRLSYRETGSTEWRPAIDLPYDSGTRNGVAVLPAQYRGALLLLEPGSSFDVRAVHDDGSAFTFTARTRRRVADLPVARTIRVHDSAAVLTVIKGGTADGYLLYEGPPAKASLDAQRMHDHCLTIDARSNEVRHVIFRNIRFTGALKHCVLLGSAAARNSERITDIIFDNCEFTNWGSPGTHGCPFAGNLQSGIYSAASALENVTVQRCHFHNPAFGANSWYADEGKACTGTQHPEGTQCITFKGSRGGHVLRFNTFEAAPFTRFNDGAGETDNFSDAGFPGANSDIHGNVIRYVNDDGLEIEGRSQNIRVWNNLFDSCFGGIGLAPVFRGPVYIWGNVGRSSRASAKREHGHSFLKWRRSGRGSADFSGGHVYVFNNTLVPPSDGSAQGFTDLYSEHKSGHAIRNWHVWNNLVAASQRGRVKSSFRNVGGTNNDIRNNVFSGGIVAPNEVTPAAGNVTAQAIFAANDWNATTGVGRFLLSERSPGYKQGLPVPNVHEGISRPDCGAQQHSSSHGVGYGHLHYRED